MLDLTINVKLIAQKHFRFSHDNFYQFSERVDSQKNRTMEVSYYSYFPYSVQK